VFGVRLVDQGLPHEPAAQPERAQHVVERHALLGPSPAGGAGGVVVLAAAGRLAVGCPFGDQSQHAGQVVVARAQQVVAGHDRHRAVGRVLLLDRPHQRIGQRGHPAQQPRRERLHRLRRHECHLTSVGRIWSAT